VTLEDALMHTYHTVLQAQLAGTSISRQWSKAGALNSRVAKFKILTVMTSGKKMLTMLQVLLYLLMDTHYSIGLCRHPLDQQNTRLLKVLPGLETMAKNVLGMYPLMAHAQ